MVNKALISCAICTPADDLSWYSLSLLYSMMEFPSKVPAMTDLIDRQLV